MKVYVKNEAFMLKGCEQFNEILIKTINNC